MKISFKLIPYIFLVASCSKPIDDDSPAVASSISFDLSCIPDNTQKHFLAILTKSEDDAFYFEYGIKNGKPAQLNEIFDSLILFEETFELDNATVPHRLDLGDNFRGNYYLTLVDQNLNREHLPISLIPSEISQITVCPQPYGSAIVKVNFSGIFSAKNGVNCYFYPILHLIDTNNLDSLLDLYYPSPENFVHEHSLTETKVINGVDSDGLAYTMKLKSDYMYFLMIKHPIFSKPTKSLYRLIKPKKNFTQIYRLMI